MTVFKLRTLCPPPHAAAPPKPASGRCPRTSTELYPPHLSEALSDDELRLVLGFLDARSLSAFACSGRRVRGLANDHGIWHALLRDHLRRSHWSIDAATPIALSRLQVVRLLMEKPRHALTSRRAVRASGAGTSTQLRLVEAGALLPDVLALAGELTSPLAVTTASPASPSARRLLISEDGLSVRFVGERLGGNRAVRCEPHLPRAPHDVLRFVRRPDGDSISHELAIVPREAVSYFEVELSRRAGDGAESELDCIAVGLGTDDFPLSGRQPGWDAHSFGYHSDDGRVFHGSGTRSRPFGPRFGPGDVVGCGMSLVTREVFYTLNGAYLGVAFVARPSLATLYPIVGLDSHTAVGFNFGERPFTFDLSSLPASLSKAHAPSALSLRHIALRFL